NADASAQARTTKPNALRSQTANPTARPPTPPGIARASQAPTTKQSNKNPKKLTNNTRTEDGTSKPR
ncbi:hypothetical protein, partial [Paraburkholderia hospita]|uniref:hypothetical protein n=1 Tax=Paraburkholderia hospita TaxID=169430 RepID=UPI001A994F47